MFQYILVWWFFIWSLSNSNSVECILAESKIRIGDHDYRSGLSELCGCGCRGWCSVYPLLEAFRRDLSEQHPDLRLPIIDIKCDWAALVEVAALRTWSHNHHACPCCLVKKAQLEKIDGFSARSCPFPLYDESKYEATLSKNFKDLCYRTLV